MVDTALRNEAKKTNEALARIEALLTRLCDGLEADRVEREAVPVVTDLGGALHERLVDWSKHWVAMDAVAPHGDETEVEASGIRGHLRLLRGWRESTYPDAFIQRASIEAQIEKYEARLKELEGSGANDEHQ